MADYERFIPFRAQSQDTGQAQMFQNITDRLRSFSEQIYTQSVAPTIEARARTAGAAAGAAGTPELRSNFTLYGRAYNDSAVRAYALTQYSDVEKNLSQFESQAGTDVEKYSALVKGYRDGAVQGVMPEARMFVSQMIDETAGEARTRIIRAAAVRARETQRTEIAGGLDTMAGKISKLYLSGSPEELQRAQTYGQTYLEMVDASVADGTFSPKEGAALKDNHLKNSIEWLAAGRLEAEYRIPGGNPTRFINDVLTNPELSDADRQQLARNLYGRLELMQRADAAAASEAAAASKAEADRAERELTSDLLNGRLTGKKIDEAIRTRGLDPAVGRTLFEKIKAGPGQTDEREAFIISTSLLSYTEQEIANNPRLDWNTKAQLIERRRTRMVGWPDTNNAQEARQRIDRAVGIIPGIPNPLVSQEVARQRGEAQTRWFDLVNALPPDQREAQAIPLAEQVVRDVIKQRAQASLPALQRQLVKAQQDLAAADSDAEKAVIQRRINSINQKITEARSGQ